MTKILSPQAAHWFRASMSWSGQFWDDEANLLKAVKHTGQHDVRNSVWYALGLLQDGKQAQAEHIIWTVMRYQYDTPDKVYHGTFKRSPLEPDPGDKPVEWRDYDPNWREFICTIFLLMLTDFELSPDLQAAMWQSIHLATEGAFTRNVEPAYTNIALMSALLLDHAGLKFANHSWRERAEEMARAVYALFEPQQTFWEYNSPTYYGTDLYALSLWINYGLTATFKALGLKMEAQLWRDIARFYHAGLQNLCGPYDRSYGMNMKDYLALVGLYIALVVPIERAPLPDISKPFEHAHDFKFGPVVAYTGTRVPRDVLPDLLDFQRERQLERVIEPGRSASAYLSHDVMLGAETPHPSRLPDSQFHAVTAHWRQANGELAWLRLLSGTAFSAHVNKMQLTLELGAAQTMVLEVNASGIEETTLAARCWYLPDLQIQHRLPDAGASREGARIRFEVPAGEWEFTFSKPST